MNPYVVTVCVPLLLGLALIPWNVALSRMSNGPFFIFLGVAFVLVGLLSMRGAIVSASAILPAILAATLYVGSLWLFNVRVIGTYVVGQQMALGVAAAMIATFPVFSTVAEAAYFRRMPSLAQVFFMLVVIGGLVGLSLTGNDR